MPPEYTTTPVVISSAEGNTGVAQAAVDQIIVETNNLGTLKCGIVDCTSLKIGGAVGILTATPDFVTPKSS